MQKKELIIQKSIVIHKPIGYVFDFLKIVRNQDKFSVWNRKDPHKQTTSEGVDGTEGFVYSWDSKQRSVGAGSQTLTRLLDSKCIEYALNFERPMRNTATASFFLEELGVQDTKVTWEFRSPTRFPMSLFAGVFKIMLGKDLAQSLRTLKEVLEA